MKSGKWYLSHAILLTIAAGSLFGTGCRKEISPDNNNVIRTPYGLYFSDKLGVLYNTNDGKSFKQIFLTDGVAARSISTSGNNLFWIKKNLHVSKDNGLNFNPAMYNNSTFVTPSPTAHWQSMMLDVPSHGWIYVASTTAASSVMISKDHGEIWENDPGWSAFSGLSIQSFAQVKNGKLYAIDNNGPRIFERTGAGLAWKEVIMTLPLPPGQYFLSNFNNALIAADVTGAGGIFHSDDGGVTWANYAGIPTNQEIYSVAGPLGQVLLAGTDSAGIYRLVDNRFQPSNNGLEPFTKVYGITGKQDMYKNDIITQFVYIATNKGLFRSEDLGQNWTLVRPGDIRTLY